MSWSLISALAAGFTAIVFVLIVAVVCAGLAKAIQRAINAGGDDQFESRESAPEDEGKVCPNRTCRYANRPLARFCSQCGQRLR